MAYSKYAALVYDHTKCGSGNSTNFTALVDITDANLKSTGNSGLVTDAQGDDICFFSDSGLSSLLSWHLESWDAATGQIRAWVKIATLNASADGTIYIAAGNAAITTFQGGSTGSEFDANTAACYRLADGTTLSALDATANAKNGTINSATATAGVIDGAAAFSGVLQNIALPNTLGISGGTARTFSAWVKRGANTTAAIFGGGIGTDGNAWIFYTNLLSTGDLYCAFVNNDYYTATLALPNDGNYHKVDLIYDGGTLSTSTVHISVDNSAKSLTKAGAGNFAANTTDGNDWHLGSEIAGAGLFTGSIDEAKFSTVARNSDWIAAEYNNQGDNSHFWTLGSWATPASAARANRMATLGVG